MPLKSEYTYKVIHGRQWEVGKDLNNVDTFGEFVMLMFYKFLSTNVPSTENQTDVREKWPTVGQEVLHLAIVAFVAIFSVELINQGARRGVRGNHSQVWRRNHHPFWDIVINIHHSHLHLDHVPLWTWTEIRTQRLNIRPKPFQWRHTVSTSSSAGGAIDDSQKRNVCSRPWCVNRPAQGCKQTGHHCISGHAHSHSPISLVSIFSECWR